MYLKMKSIKFFAIVLISVVLSHGANAQIEKGKWLMGGSTKFGFSTGTTKIELNGESQTLFNNTSFNFSPQVGCFISDGFVIGFEFPIAFEKIKSEISGIEYESKSSSIAIAPYFRYYVDGSNVKPYLHFSAGFGSISNDVQTDMDAPQSKGKFFLVNMGGGFIVFVNDHIAFDFGASYTKTKITTDYYMGITSDSDFKIIESGFNFGIGLLLAF